MPAGISAVYGQNPREQGMIIDTLSSDRDAIVMTARIALFVIGAITATDVKHAMVACAATTRIVTASNAKAAASATSAAIAVVARKKAAAE